MPNHVLVATAKTQGARENDFSWTLEGELVMFPFECDGETVDGPCGCRRSLLGLDSKKSTTTFMVADLPYLTREMFVSKVADNLMTSWGFKERHAVSAANVDVDTLLGLAGLFSVGTVLERRGNYLKSRE